MLQIAKQVETGTGVDIVHETHRGRFAFAAHVTKTYLDKIPDLRLTFDVSHWCNVAETLLHDQQDAVNAAIKAAQHIHARIGFEQAAQVADPAMPQYREAMQFHLQCWDSIVNHHQNVGKEFLTITPEFGPAPYMPCGQPETEQWQYNIDIKNLLTNRYQAS